MTRRLDTVPGSTDSRLSVFMSGARLDAWTVLEASQRRLPDRGDDG